MIIDRINEPKDLKNLNQRELNVLAGEIRNAIINKLSVKGGHLASNLGVIELTVALHYVFNSPTDKIIFDVVSSVLHSQNIDGKKKCFFS